MNICVNFNVIHDFALTSYSVLVDKCIDFLDY